MTLKAKFAQMASLLQDMEHSLKMNLDSKPSLPDIEALVKKEVDNLYQRLRDDLKSQLSQEPVVASREAFEKKCYTQLE